MSLPTVPPSTVNPSAAKDGTPQNCNSNNSQGKDDQAPTDALLKDLTNVNSGAHTDSNVKGNGRLADEIVPESQEQNGKKCSSKTHIDSIGALESPLASNGNDNLETQLVDVPDGARAADSSAPPNPPTSQPKSHKLIRGRKKSNKEGNLCICVYLCVCCLRLNVHISQLFWSAKMKKDWPSLLFILKLYFPNILVKLILSFLFYFIKVKSNDTT